MRERDDAKLAVGECGKGTLKEVVSARLVGLVHAKESGRKCGGDERRREGSGWSCAFGGRSSFIFISRVKCGVESRLGDGRGIDSVSGVASTLRKNTLTLTRKNN